MNTSLIRTIAIGANGFALGPPQWPVAQPDDDPDYTLDVTLPLADVDDTLAQVAASSAPSGDGEPVIGNVSVDGYLITLEVSGGVAGRQYIVKVDATTAGNNYFTWVVGLQIDPTLAQYPLVTPPSLGFSEPESWVTDATPSIIVLTGRKIY